MMAVAKFLRPIGGPLLAALLAVAALSATLARAQDRDMDFDVIYAELEPYGSWFEHPVWGTVWRPHVDAEWRPYAHGSWLYTDDYGWYWQAEEPWGWAPFHYGRWLIDEDGSWIWIPDSEWGPAWVAWRWSEDYVGWAPLPPQAGWGADGELAFDPAVLGAPGFLALWCFVRPHQLILPGLHRFFVARRHAPAIFRSTRALPGPRKVEGRFINTGFDVKRFEHMTGRPVVRLRLRSVDSPQAADRGRGGGPEISVFKPRLIARPEGGRIHRPATFDRPPGSSLMPATADPGAAAGRSLPPKSEVPSAAPGQVSRGQDGASPPTSNPAAGADPGSPKVGAPLLAPPGDRRPDRAPPAGDARRRQPPPAVSGGEGDHRRGPPPGMMQRSYGGPAQGLPRAYNPGGRPPNGPPPTLHTPAPAAGPAPRAPSPNPQRPPPRKDDNRGPG